VGRTRNEVRVVGGYEIVRELGRGGMATVYLARQADLDRLVALKELSAFRRADASFTERFLRESRLAGSLSHPNVVTVHDYFEHDETPYIAMEYVEGGSLRPRIGHVSLTQVAGALEGILAALSYAEKHHVVHRDLKPENVLVTSDGRVKITDFGIAKATGGAGTAGSLTATGSTLGTPNYMAPEQAMGEEVGPRTDLYAVGVMAFELFVGEVPFHDTEEPMAVMMRQVNDPIPPPSALNPEVDPAVSDWIEHLLVKDPEERPRSAGEAWDQFEEIIIEMVGPRWRRAARLVEPSERPADAPAGPATPPPVAAAQPPLMPSREVPSRPPAKRRRTIIPSEAPTRRLREEEEAALANTVMPQRRTRRLDPDDQPPRAGKTPRWRRRLRLAAVAALLLLALAAALGGRSSTPGGSGGKPAATPPAGGAPRSAAPAPAQPSTGGATPAPQSAPRQSAPPQSDIGDSKSDDPSDDSANP
jgi:serine/threonine protein kinase